MKTVMPNPKEEPITYEMLGGGTIRGSTPRELAEALRNSSYTPLDSLEEFVVDVAKRCRAYDYRFLINQRGVATIKSDGRCKVMGVLWELRPR